MARGRGRERSNMREEIKEGIEALFRKQDVEDAVLRQLILLPEGEEAERRKRVEMERGGKESHSRDQLQQDPLLLSLIQ